LLLGRCILRSGLGNVSGVRSIVRVLLSVLSIRNIVMPINDYFCLHCGTSVEVLSTKESEPCPNCPYMMAKQPPRVAPPNIQGFSAKNNYGKQCQ